MPDAASSPKLRVVLDSNVSISGFAFERGNPSKILDLLRQGEFEAVISPFILDEVSRSFREDFGWSEARIEEARDRLVAFCQVIDPLLQATQPGLTPGDNRILDCAWAGEAIYLVTGDKGIQRVKEFKGIQIVNPAEFLLRFKSSG